MPFLITKKSQRNEFHWLNLSHYLNDTMRRLLETGTDAMLAFDEKRTHWPSYPDHFFFPGILPPRPSFLPFRGKTSNLTSALNNFSKIGAICLKKPGFPAVRADFVRDFYGDGMGRAKREEGRGEGEKLLGKTLLFGFFRTSFNYFGAPERERIRGWRGMAWGAKHKKGAQKRIPEPLLWGVIEMKTCSRPERREHAMSAFDEKCTHCPDYFDLFFSPGAPPQPPHFFPFRGQTSS